MTEYNKKKSRFVSVVVYLIGFLSIFVPWVQYSEKSYSLLGFVAHIWKSGGPFGFAENRVDLLVYGIALHIPLAAGILAGIFALCLAVKKDFHILYMLILWLTFIYIAFAVVLFPYDVFVWTYALPMLYVAEFIIRKYLTEREEFIEWREQVKQEAKEEKEEEERRLAFEGKYSSQLYKIILMNVKYHIRSYVMLIVSASFFTAFLFLVFALQAMFQEIHSEEMMLLGQGVQRILIQAMKLGVASSVIMMALSFSYYLRNKLKDENVFMLLGIRSQTLNAILRFEYIGCMVCSLILGFVTGNAALVILKRILRRELPLGAVHISVKYYALTFIIFVAAVLIASAVNYEIYRKSRFRDADVVMTKKIRVPGKLALIPGIAGVLLFVISILGFTKRANAESIGFQCIFFLGIFLCMFCVQAFLLKGIQKSENRYYRKLISRMDYFEKFKKNVVIIALLCVVHILIMYTFTSEIAGITASPEEKELYPYDFVCMSYEDEDDYFEELKEKYGLEMHKIPMFRVTSVQGEAADWVDGMGNYFMHVIWPQGQHAGISESSYEELLELLGEDKQDLNLEGENIHVVYQQDQSFKVHPIDWYLTEFKPYLRNGLPVEQYAFLEREKLYPPRDVQSEEIRILTGMFVRGEQENLVVFSDEYFDEARSEVMANHEGPEEIVLLKTNAKQYDAVESELQEFKERHKEDSRLSRSIQPYYGKHQMIQDTKSERYLKIVVWIFVILAIGLSGILLIMLKFVFEMDEFVNKYQFLSCIGIRSRDLKRELRQEMLPFWTGPFAVSVISSCVFTAISFSLRKFDMTAVYGYVKCAAIIWGVYWLVQVLCFAVIRRMLLKKIEEGREV